MIGEQYFPLRQELAKLTAEALILAKASGCDDSVFEPLHRLRQEEQAALLMLVLGDNPQGNVEFISSLIGLTEMLPSEQQGISRLRHYVHGKTLRLSEKEPEVEGLEINALFLNDFEILDTPGAAFHSESLRSMILRCVPAADFILAVISAADPWNKSTWKLLKEIPGFHRSRVIILLQRLDSQRAVELLPLEKDILDHCRRDLRMQPPLFIIPYEPPAQTPGLPKEDIVQPLLEHIYYFSNPDKHRKGLFRARVEMLAAVTECILAKLPPDGREPFPPLEKPGARPEPTDHRLLDICEGMAGKVQETIRESEKAGLQELKMECGPVKGLFYERDKGFQMWSVFSEKVMATVAGSAEELIHRLEKEMAQREPDAPVKIIDYDELRKDLSQSPRRFLNSMTWQNRFFFALSARQQKLRALAVLFGAGLILTLAGALGGWPWAWWTGLGMAMVCSAIFWLNDLGMEKLYQFWQKSVTRAAVGVRDSLAVVLHHEVTREIKHRGDSHSQSKMSNPMPQPLLAQAENLQNRIGRLRERLDGSME